MRCIQRAVPAVGREGAGRERWGLFCAARGRERWFLTGCKQNRVFERTGTRKYVATEPLVWPYRATSTMSHLKRQRHNKWRVFSVNGCSRSCTLVLPPVKTRRPRPPAAPNKPHRYLPALSRPTAGTARCVCTMSGSEVCRRWGETQLPRLAVGRSTADRASAGVLSGDFVGLVPAFLDTCGPKHTQRRGAAPCASRGRRGCCKRARDRRDRFDANRVWGGGGGVGEWRPTRRPCSPADSPPPSPRRDALVVLTGQIGAGSGGAQNVEVAPL